MSRNFVAHDCRNSRNPEWIQTGKKRDERYPNPEYCNNRWVDEDLTNVKTLVPTWKYCKECCEKLGIDFEKQQPSDYRTPEKNEQIKKKVQELVASRKQNIKSEIWNTNQI